MNTSNPKPVVFITFANDRDERVGYLRNLPEEARRIRGSLERAAREGLCEVVERSNATLKDILDVFQDPDQRNRIAIFHYGGHANGYELLLESEKGIPSIADGKGLAAFLGQQTGLQLVFLNACATQPHVQGLLDAQVPAVIATARAIEDAAAMEFAGRFYQALAAGAALRTAYEEAAAAVRTAGGGTTRHLYAAEQPASDRWPWDFFIRPGAKVSVDRWNLPEAAGNPLFGLPPLPAMDLPASPYRNLEWFKREHAEIFFGRGYQVRDLYQRVTEPASAPIILFYGQSGVGKSSVLAAGLIPRLEGGHAVSYLRRDAKLDLCGMLAEAVRVDNSGGSVRDAWRAGENALGKPHTVILDQVEEAFTRPNANVPNELSLFFDFLAALYRDPSLRPRGKLILGFSKEWLAEIERQLVERKLPSAKVFLERLDKRGIIQAVAGPVRAERLQQHYRFEVAAGLPEVIADDLLEDRESPVAPTLQILLTKMWDAAGNSDSEKMRFDLDLYQGLKKQGILLKDFLDQQLAALENSEPKAVGFGLALDILNYHTTDLGSAEERSAEELRTEYAANAQAATGLVGRCKDLYLLTESQSRKQAASPASRLAHDTLAPLVRRLFSQSDKKGQRARRILESRVVDWKDGIEGNPLDEADLKVVEDGAAGMRDFKDDEKRLVKASRVKRREREIERRKQEETRRWIRILGLAAIVAIVLFAGLALKQKEKAEEQSKAAFARQLAAQAVSQRNRGLDLALLLSIESIKVGAGETITESRGSLLAALSYSPRLKAYLSGHEGEISSVALSRRGRKTLLASGDLDGQILLWDVSDIAAPKRLPPILNTHRGAVNSVCFSLNGRLLAAGGNFKEILLWDVSDVGDLKRRETLPNKHQKHVYSLSISQQGDKVFLASGGGSGEIFLWNISDPRVAEWLGEVPPGHKGVVSSVSFSPYGNTLVSRDRSGKIFLWDVSDPRKPKSVGNGLKGPEGSDNNYNVAFSPDGTTIASGDKGGEILRWNVSDLHAVQRLESKNGGHKMDVNSVAFSSQDGKTLLASGGLDGKILLWDVTDSRSMKRLESELIGHKGWVNSITFSPDGHILASAGRDEIILWDVSTPEAEKPLGKPLIEKLTKVNNVAFGCQGSNTLYASAGSEGISFGWDVSSPGAVKPLQPLSIDSESGVECVAFGNHNGKALLAAGSGKEKIFLWDVSSPGVAKPLQPLSIDSESSVNCVAFGNHNGKTLLSSGGGNGKIFLWDVSDPNKMERLKPITDPNNNRIKCLSFSQRGNILASGSDGEDGKDGKILLWDISDLLDVKFLKPELSGHKMDVNSVAFSPNGKILASGGGGGEILLWDVSDPRSVKRIEVELTGHKFWVKHVTFSPDGKILASGGGGGEILLWDVSNPLSVKRMESDLRTYGGEVKSLAFSSPNGKMLVSGSDDGQILLWDMNWLSLQKSACRIANRNLSRIEWNRHLGQFYTDEEYHKTCEEVPEGN